MRNVLVIVLLAGLVFGCSGGGGGGGSDDDGEKPIQHVPAISDMRLVGANLNCAVIGDEYLDPWNLQVGSFVFFEIDLQDRDGDPKMWFIDFWRWEPETEEYYWTSTIELKLPTDLIGEDVVTVHSDTCYQVSESGYYDLWAYIVDKKGNESEEFLLETYAYD